MRVLRTTQHEFQQMRHPIQDLNELGDDGRWQIDQHAIQSIYSLAELSLCLNGGRNEEGYAFMSDIVSLRGPRRWLLV